MSDLFFPCFSVLHVGHSCKLLTKNMGMLVINEDTLDVSITCIIIPWPLHLDPLGKKHFGKGEDEATGHLTHTQLPLIL